MSAGDGGLIAQYYQAFRLERGGVVRAVIDLVSALAGRGRRVRVLTHDAADAPAAWRGAASGVELVELGPRSASGRLSRAQASAAAGALREASVLHLHTCWLPANDQLAGWARRTGLPYVFSVHGMLDDWAVAQGRLRKAVYHRLVGVRTFRGAAAVHCTAEAEWAQVSRRVEAEGAVIPLMLDTGWFEAAGGGGDQGRDGDEPFTVLFLGRLHPKKGVEVAIDAARRLVEAGRDARLVIAGGGEAAYVEGLRRRAEPLGERARFAGVVSGEAKRSLLASAGAFVLPTAQENFGLAMFEALACGTPVVTTRAVDTRPELERSGGAVFAEREAGAFAAALSGLMNDAGRRSALGAAGRAWTLEHLAPGRVVSAYEALYGRVGRGAA